MEARAAAAPLASRRPHSRRTGGWGSDGEAEDEVCHLEVSHCERCVEVPEGVPPLRESFERP